MWYCFLLENYVQADIQLNEGMAKLLVKHREVCSKKSNVDPKLLEKARKGDFSDNPDFRKHVYCVAQEIGFLDGSGKIQFDVLKTKSTIIFGERADKMITACVSEKEDPIETAVKTFKCYYDKGDLVLL
nr:odorant binding protein 10 [Apriona germarii]